MLITPAIVALQLIALSVVGTVLLAGGFAWRILRHWDIHSGSELQVCLERQTYLISTLLGFALGAELLSLLLFIHTAENLSSQFIGAMCATGVLNINAFGFPTLLLKITVFFLAALWLWLNRVDNQGDDYPLVRVKYGLLMVIAPLTVLEGATQTAFFLGLEPEVITSCCGSLFSAEGRGVAAELAGWPVRPALALFYTMAGLLLAVGLAFRRWPGLGPLFAAGSVLSFSVAIVVIIAVLSLYVYENPNHHCPFCLLKAGYGYVGYALYIPLFAATAAGLSAGLITPFRRVVSLQAVIPGEVRHLIGLALAGFGLFYALATWLMLRSPLILLN
ncbi:MAG TPA: hypothetical protein P5102_06240 [Candidatus Competibacteraceae bacterium]|nr:hypothetical protein [Candidatus Competibacteraceae bacterium]HRZ05738.1 hypothetical protein [Candidatus Competibacteraceae bacterium]HSA45884.1 hypothetical protein [Candidatus Competibacteraceae bacterium]